MLSSAACRVETVQETRRGLTGQGVQFTVSTLAAVAVVQVGTIGSNENAYPLWSARYKMHFGRGRVVDGPEGEDRRA
jgi:hypothetical protein